MENNEIMLKMENITKLFPGVTALENVNFSLRSGEVHALVGENGAGKTTLMNILSGVIKPNKGEIYINGNQVNIKNPLHALQLGIGFVHQERSLVNTLSVRENIFIERYRLNKYGFIKWNKLNEDVRKLLNTFKIKANPTSIVSEMSVAQQQLIEVAKALSKEPNILILDEPTASLSENEVKMLFSAIREYKEKSKGIIYISHRLDEIFNLSDVITVLRDGKYVGTYKSDEIGKQELVSLMIGKKLSEQLRTKSNNFGEVVLSVKDLSTRSKLKNISFDLKKGEVLGVFGLVGSGRTELARAIYGADPLEKGKIYINGREIRPTPRKAIISKIGMVPEDRKGNGLVLKLSVKNNISLASLKNISLYNFILKKKENKVCNEQIKKLNIKTPNTNQITLYLSGGNQQKVVLAKWLSANCDVLIMDEPTFGIDIGAKNEIFKLVDLLAKSGKSIIYISSEMSEVLGISDRIVIMHEGIITGNIEREDANEELLIQKAMGI